MSAILVPNGTDINPGNWTDELSGSNAAKLSDANSGTYWLPAIADHCFWTHAASGIPGAAVISDVAVRTRPKTTAADGSSHQLRLRRAGTTGATFRTVQGDIDWPTEYLDSGLARPGGGTWQAVDIDATSFGSLPNWTGAAPRIYEIQLEVRWELCIGFMATVGGLLLPIMLTGTAILPAMARLQ